MLSSEQALTSVILAGKRDIHRHSTTGFIRKNVVVTEISNVIKCKKFYYFAMGRRLNFLQ